MSNLVYVITVDGSCSGYLRTCLQIIQNTAARCVTGLGWYTAVPVLLLQCGWLSVRQMIAYHSLVLLFKIRADGKPSYLHEKLTKAFNYRTRLATTNAIRKDEKIGSDIRKDSFLPRTSNDWNSLPENLRMIKNLKKFKLELKTWIKKNVEI